MVGASSSTLLVSAATGGRITRITMLTNSTQAGNSSWNHLCSPAATSRRQRDQVPEERDQRGSPAVRIPSVLTEMREHCCHPHGIDRDQRLGRAATIRKEFGVGIGSGEQRQQAGRGDCADEQHRQEEQPAAQKDCGEQPILHVAELLADDADEPQEGDPGKRHQLEAQPDQALSLDI